LTSSEADAGGVLTQQLQVFKEGADRLIALVFNASVKAADRSIPHDGIRPRDLDADAIAIRVGWSVDGEAIHIQHHVACADHDRRPVIVEIQVLGQPVFAGRTQEGGQRIDRNADIGVGEDRGDTGEGKCDKGEEARRIHGVVGEV
jgi:hypothetical protein